MACDKCSVAPGKLIPIDTKGNCSYCGTSIVSGSLIKSTSRWDKYYLEVCKAISSKSPCLSRQIGAILVRDKSIISTGYNGPARGFPHCSGDICPRRVAGHKSGEGLEHCPASHAEMNCIANAARIGTNACNSVLYMNSVIPCKFCAVILVNAGVKEIVVEDLIPYHEMSIDIFIFADVKLRSFEK